MYYIHQIFIVLNFKFNHRNIKSNIIRLHNNVKHDIENKYNNTPFHAKYLIEF